MGEYVRHLAPLHNLTCFQSCRCLGGGRERADLFRRAVGGNDAHERIDLTARYGYLCFFLLIFVRHDRPIAGNQDLRNEIAYLQSQNDNLNLATAEPDGEFKAIRGDIPPDIPWATEALGLRQCFERNGCLMQTLRAWA